MPRCWFVFLVVLAGCVPTLPPVTEPPKLVEGGWTLVKSTPVPPHSWTTLYAGPQDIAATFHLHNSNTEAFEAMQKWQKAPGEITFHDGNFLIVVHAKDIPKQASGDFVEGLTKAIH